VCSFPLPPAAAAAAAAPQGRDSLFDNVTSCGVDPRSIAQRIMDIRTQLSEEFIQELQAIAEENSLLLRCVAGGLKAWGGAWGFWPDVQRYSGCAVFCWVVCSMLHPGG
jgi:hypothetical protein